MAVISVKDNGVGIPESEIAKVGDRFFRASTSKGFSGSGIGINLVKMILEMHGGHLAVSSIEGKGSTFTVYLPMASAPEAHRAA
mgnify:CR=1 FL=1